MARDAALVEDPRNLLRPGQARRDQLVRAEQRGANPSRRSRRVLTSNPCPLWHGLPATLGRRSWSASLSRSDTVPLNGMRLVSVLLLVVLLACSQPSAPETAAPDTTRPNVVLVLADDQGWGETGYNGHPYLETPTLDEAAAGGLLFERFYAAAPNCSPTRTSILTGRHPNRSGVFAPNHTTRPEEITIPQIVREAGYRHRAFRQVARRRRQREFADQPGPHGLRGVSGARQLLRDAPAAEPQRRGPEIIRGESSAICVDAALEFLKRVRDEGEEPFFVTLWFGSPHSPYRALPEDQERYRDVPGDELRDRFSEITAMDRALGRFRSELRQMGEAENTLLWYTSDNGITVEGMPEDQRTNLWNGGWRGHKGDLYEGGLRVPAFIEWPAVVKQPRKTLSPGRDDGHLHDLAGVVGTRPP